MEVAPGKGLAARLITRAAFSSLFSFEHSPTLSGKPMPAPTNRRNLIAGGPGHREGKIQRAARRALIGATTSTVSTVTMMAMAYPAQPWTRHRWTQMCRSARKWAVPVLPRTRPIFWKLKKPVD